MRTASVTIRNIPAAVLNRLKHRATANRRSMQGELLSILESAAVTGQRFVSAAELLSRARASGLDGLSESTAMIRADRDR